MSGATKLLIRGGQVYDHDGDVHRPGVADILIEGDRIAAVGTNLAAHGEHDLIDASGRLVIPGLINAHYHSHDTLCRGLFEELPLEMRLLYTIPMGQNRSREEVRARTLVGALESLRCGITTVQDMLGLVPLNHEYTDVVLSAYREAGIRVVFSPMVSDLPPVAMVRHKDLLPSDVQCRSARRSIISRTNSSIILPAARCTGPLRPLRRSVARQRCWRRWPSLRRRTTCRFTRMSTRHAASS